VESEISFPYFSAAWRRTLNDSLRCDRNNPILDLLAWADLRDDFGVAECLVIPSVSPIMEKRADSERILSCTLR